MGYGSVIEFQAWTLCVCTSSPMNLSPVSGNHFEQNDIFFESLSTFSAEPCDTDTESRVRTYRCVHLPVGLTSVKTHQNQQMDCPLGALCFRTSYSTSSHLVAARSEDEALAPLLVPRPLWLSPMTTKNFSLGFGRPGFQMSWGNGLRSVFIRSEGMGLDSLVVSSPWVLCDFCAPVLHLGLESSNAKGTIWDVHLGAVNPVDSCAFYLEKWGQLLPKLKAALRFPYLDSVGKW